MQSQIARSLLRVEFLVEGLLVRCAKTRYLQSDTRVSIFVFKIAFRGLLLSIGRQRISVYKTRACQINASKHADTAKCGSLSGVIRANQFARFAQIG